MRRLVPSSGSLLAFEAVARHLSFSRAADELALTQSAVSRQIKTLEDLLNTRLFERLSKGLVLTPAGEIYLPMVIEALDTLSGASSQILNLNRAESTVRLICTPSLASQVVIPSLVRFHARHPDIHVEVTTDRNPINLAGSHYDMAINMGRSAWPGTMADVYLTSRSTVVCAPSLRKRIGFRSQTDLAKAELLQMIGLPGIWADWAEKGKIELNKPHEGWRFEQFQHVLDAVRAGAGLAILPEVFARGSLERKEIVEIYQDLPTLDFSYLLYIRNDRISAPAVIRLRDWLFATRDAPQGYSETD